MGHQASCEPSPSSAGLGEAISFSTDNSAGSMPKATPMACSVGIGVGGGRGSMLGSSSRRSFLAFGRRWGGRPRRNGRDWLHACPLGRTARHPSSGEVENWLDKRDRALGACRLTWSLAQRRRCNRRKLKVLLRDLVSGARVIVRCQLLNDHRGAGSRDGDIRRSREKLILRLQICRPKVDL